jgi:hypothetical protein
MGNLTTATAQFVRNVFGRRRAAQDAAVSSKELIHSVRGVGYSGFDVDASNISEALGLDRRRLHRYHDYESMDEYPDISSALDIYADDCTQVDSTTRRSMWVESDDERVRHELDELFYKRLEIEDHIWPQSRTLSKYGNNFEEIILDETGVIGLNYMPPATVRRIEDKRGNLMGFAQSYGGGENMTASQFGEIVSPTGAAVSGQRDIAVFEGWRVVHMRLLSKYRESLYGWSVVDPARWIWKRLMLLEDAVLVYKLTRSPSRYAYYVDVGGMPTKEANKVLADVKRKMKKVKFVNPKTGKLDLNHNPMAFDEDIFLGVREGKESVRVDVLNGPNYQQVEDVQYFLNKLYAAIKVPKAYLGYDENMPSKATLSQEDVRFARTVLRVQREMRNGLGKVARVHLAARKIDPAAVDFKIAMTVPSAIFELGQMEVRRARADLAASMERHVSMHWLLSNVYGLSDDEIEQVTKEKAVEAKAQAAMGGEGLEGRDISGVPLHSMRSMGQYAPRIPISEAELMRGNREHEKQVEGAVKRAMEKSDSSLAKQLKETGHLVREIARAVGNAA